MNNTIKPIGEVLKPNIEGYFVSSINQKKPLQKEWQRPVNVCVQEIQNHLPNLISSIYVRGSVARGMAIPRISDIDLVVVTKNKLPSEYSTEWVTGFVKYLRKIYPQVGGVEFETITLTSLLNVNKHMGLRVLLKLQGKLLVGDDLLKRLPPIKSDSEAFVHIPTFSRFQAKIKNTLVAQEVFLPAYIPWVAKRYIRTGFELCIEREKVFTRDLYPCYKIFSKYYPGMKQDMHKLLEQSINPTWSKEILNGYVYVVGDWLEQKIRKEYLT